MLILHLSDLHFGTHSRFKGEDLAKLGKAFFKDLTAARGSFAKDSRIDLVAVTGDIAESGKPAEFKDGERFLAALAGELGLDRRRFVFVPGNHDVSWTDCKRVVLDQEDQGFDESELRRRMDHVKLVRYEEFLRSFYGVEDLNEVTRPLGRGAHLYSFPDLHLSVAALNTCEKESHRPADHVGFLSRDQAEALMGEWSAPEKSGWLKIVTLHHNPVVTVAPNIASWRKEIEEKGLPSELAARYESDVVGFEGRDHLKAIVEDDHVQLILHGHHHAKDEQSWDWRSGAKGRAAVLSLGSLTLKADKLPEDEPLSLRLIELDTDKKEIRAKSLIYNPRGRTAGELRPGSFVPDPVEPDGYRQDLYLPPSFEPKRTRKTKKSKASANSSAFVRNYRLSLGASFSRWDLAPVGRAQTGGAGKPNEAKLDDMYQPLRLAEGFNIEDTKQGEPITPEALLGRSRPLAIRAAAGAGKTTWMRWTFRRLLGEGQALPLMLVVRDLARYWQSPGCIGAARSLVGFLDAWAAERMGTGWEGELRKSLEAADGPRPILLVDGWDEAGKLGEELREKLVGLLVKCPRMLAVVTSRPYGDGRPSHAEGFEVLDVQPLTDTEIQDFAHRFYRQCYGDDEITAAKEAECFWSALERSQQPRALARTALLLTMMLLIGHSRISDKRHLLYEECIDNLLTALPDRKAEEGALLLHEQWRPEDSEERKRVVARLAFMLQSEGGYLGSYSGTCIVRDWDGMASFLPTGWSKKQRRGFLAWLAGPAGLLNDRADSTLAFTHLSFQEYLTAWHLNANIEGAEERIQEFGRYMDLTWWETLRLWAALIEGQSPDRLEPVLETLMSWESKGLALAGTIFADGLGNVLQFERWKEQWQSEQLTDWDEFDLCANFWATSRQEARKQNLEASLYAQMPGTHWLGWARIKRFFGVNKPVVRPSFLVSRSVLKELYREEAPSADSVAAGRILSSGVPLWPINPPKLGLLQVWPGDRRTLGLSLQSASSLGFSKSEAEKLLQRLPKRIHDELGLLDSFARDAAGRFAYILDYRHSYSLSRGLILDVIGLSRGLAQDLARYLTLYSYHCLHGGLRELALLSTSGFVFRLSHDFGFGSSQSFGTALVRYLTNSRDSMLASRFSSREDKIFKQVESLSFGRVGARSFLAYSRSGTESPEATILSAACRLSLHPSDDDRVLTRVLGRHEQDVDPLWPALARHLARRATPGDRALLTDLAQHPEKREPPLSWGLQFIVRGDVLFDDGSVVTLDELCDEAGVSRLPYLEDLPDELEVDWTQRRSPNAAI